MALIFFMSHQEGGESGRLSKVVAIILKINGYDLFALFGDSAGLWVRKIAHMTEYGLLTIMLSKALSGYFSPPKVFIPAGILSVIYAASDEFHQTFIPGRVGTPSDVLIDSAGVLVAVAFLYWVYSLDKHRQA